MEEVIGKLKAINFTHAQITIQPSQGRQIRVSYSLRLEPLLQRNSRKRFRLAGAPEVNGAGDIIGFSKLSYIVEVEPSLPKIESFDAGGLTILARTHMAIWLVLIASRRYST